MDTFGFESDPFPVIDPKKYGIDDSHCENLRVKSEYRDRETGRRLKWTLDEFELLGSRWLGEDEGGEWVELDEAPDFVDYVLMDDDTDAAYYLHYMSERYGERVSRESVMKIEEPMRSAVLHWSYLDRSDLDFSQDTVMWIDDELGLGLVVTSCQICRSPISNATVAQLRNNVMHAAR